MNVKVLSVFVSIWLGFALVGGLVDGLLLGGYAEGAGVGCAGHTGDALAACQALQVELSSEGEETGISGFINKVTRWFSAGINYVTGWVNMLALNFSFFQGDFMVVGWIVRLIIASPIIAMLIIQRFGGG
jgi:hypothetical protein